MFSFFSLHFCWCSIFASPFILFVVQLEIESLTTQLARTMEESTFHEQKGQALTSAELRINELSLSLTKTKGLTTHITKESQWLKSENITLTKKLEEWTHRGKDAERLSMERGQKVKELEEKERTNETRRMEEERRIERERETEMNTVVREL